LFGDSGGRVNYSCLFLNELLYQPGRGKSPSRHHIRRKIGVAGIGPIIQIPECSSNRYLGKTGQWWIKAKKARIRPTVEDVAIVPAPGLAALANRVVGDRWAYIVLFPNKLTTELCKDVLLNLVTDAFWNHTSIRDKFKVAEQSLRNFLNVGPWQGPSESGEGQTAKDIFVNVKTEPFLKLLRNARRVTGPHIRQGVPSDRRSQILQFGHNVMRPIPPKSAGKPLPEDPTATLMGNTERNKTKKESLPNLVLKTRHSLTFTTLTIA
jgi:hypothetical protein